MAWHEVTQIVWKCVYEFKKQMEKRQERQLNMVLSNHAKLEEELKRVKEELDRQKQVQQELEKESARQKDLFQQQQAHLREEERAAAARKREMEEACQELEKESARQKDLVQQQQEEFRQLKNKVDQCKVKSLAEALEKSQVSTLADVQALRTLVQEGESAQKVTNLAEEVEALRRQVTEGEPAQKVEHLDAAMRQLQDIHEDLKKKVEKASSGVVKIAEQQVVIPEHVLKDLDAKNESRLEAVWTELQRHAEDMLKQQRSLQALVKRQDAQGVTAKMLVQKTIDIKSELHKKLLQEIVQLHSRLKVILEGEPRGRAK